MERTSVSFTVEPGMKDGDTIRLANKGHYDPRFVDRSDIVIVLLERKHDVFRRKGADLHCVLWSGH